MSDRSQIDEIKDRLDIVSVVQEYVPSLKKSGRNYFGLCPFHQEKTPSFSVNSELGMFKCFGCGEGGDVIKFIEKVEGLDFPHALEVSAKRAGIELKKFSSPQAKKIRAEKDRLFELNALVTKYFNYLLLEHKKGEEAREYLKKRQITNKSVKKFQLGFAPVGFDNLKNFLLKKGYSEKELIDWGLLAYKNNHSYDKFRNRLMFPIFDHQGDVVGFSGRVIDPEEKGPKYLNSPETPVYNKSKLLYGLYQAKEAIRKADFAVVVEGNVDIITSHQSKIENIVAPLGTALTLDQLKLLKRYCSSVYFAFDTDNAGQKALLKSLDLTEEAGLQVKAIDLGDKKDVDDLITSGKDWPKVVKKALPVIDFLIDTQAKKYNLSDSSQKARFAGEMLKLIAKVHDDLERADYIQKLSNKAGVDVNILAKKLQNKSDSISTSISDTTKTKQVFTLNDETYLLALLVQHEQWKPEVEITEGLFEDVDNLKLLETLNKKLKVGSDQEELYTNVKLCEIETFDSKKEFETELAKAVNKLKKQQIKKQIEELRYKEETEENMDELMKLTKELSTLVKLPFPN